MHSSPALLQLAFRPFFLLGALFSVFAVALWAAAAAGELSLDVYGGPLWWHIHEMLFGFVAAIVVGFLLTAVRTWTNQPGISGLALGALMLLWVAGRGALFFPDSLAPWLLASLDLSFLPIATIVLAAPIVRVKQWRNVIFVPMLLAMSSANALMHWVALSEDQALLYRAGSAMVFLVTLLMTIMAGRVLPMFTANGTQTEKVAVNTVLEVAAFATLLLAILSSFASAIVSDEWVALCFFTAALTHGLRAFRWRFWVTTKVPLLWSLHVSYWCIPVGLLLYGLSYLSTVVAHSQAIHALTVGAMGMMILSMISRVSLGHTGRALAVGPLMSVAFLSLFGAFLVRVFGLYWIADYGVLIGATAVLWIVGYGSFVVVYLPILTQSRVDGKEG